MDKGVGFNRNIKLEWLDATAAFCLEESNEQGVRDRLQSVLAYEINSSTNLRKTIAILVNIWHQFSEANPDLHREAVDLYGSTQVVSDRIWLHYGMVLLAYPFFYQTTAVIGRLSRYGDLITVPAIRNQLFSEIGQLGSLSEAANRIVYSLRDWGILEPGRERNSYVAKRQNFSSSQQRLEAWLLACCLMAQPVQEMPFADLLHLPALFPFQFTISMDELRSYEFLEIQRQGLGWNMVRVA